MGLINPIGALQRVWSVIQGRMRTEMAGQRAFLVLQGPTPAFLGPQVASCVQKAHSKAALVLSCVMSAVLVLFKTEKEEQNAVCARRESSNQVRV